MIVQQTRAFEDMSLRELTDGIGKTILIAEADGSILIGKLKYIHVNAEDIYRPTAITIIEGKDEVTRIAQWHSVIFA